MPVNKNSYQNGKVYRIWSLDTEDIYIGSSCDTLSNRFCKHKSHYKKWKEGDKRIYCSSYILFDQVGVENCKIELIKNFPCNSKSELTKEEGKVMRENKDIIVNKNQAGRTIKEYKEEHKQQLTEKMKEYKEQNREKIIQYHKEYNQQHKEEISKQNKEYYEQNKEQIKEQMKEYHEQHKEQIIQYHKEYKQQNKEKLHKKFNCECGGKFKYENKSTHEKTQKHQEYIKSR